MAAQVNVYVPDEMKERLDGAELELSRIARAAWERELEQQENTPEGTFLIDTKDADGSPVKLRFEGTEIISGLAYRRADGGAVFLLPGDEPGYSAWTDDEILDDEEEFANFAYRWAKENLGDHEQASTILQAFDVTPIVDL